MISKEKDKYIIQGEKSIPILYDVDVLVAGAGISGLFAAIAAGRMGAKTILVDRFGSVGGNIGPGLVVGGGLYNEAECTLVGGLSGIAKEFMDKLETLRIAPVPESRRSGNGWNYIEESNIVSYLGAKMAEEAGVKLLLSVYAADPIMDGNDMCGLYIEGKSGRIAIKAKTIIDATGDASIAERAGAPVISHLPADPSYGVLIQGQFLQKEYNWWNEAGALCLAAGVNYEKYLDYINSKTNLDQDFNFDFPEWIMAKLEGIPKALMGAYKNRFNERKQPIEGQVRLLAM